MCVPRSVVKEMSSAERAKLLAFCTGSARAPATGFANLMGFSEYLVNAASHHATHIMYVKTCALCVRV